MANGQSPTPSAGAEGSDLNTVANQIEGLLDDDGHFNPSPGQVSRAHPDYDESGDDRVTPSERDDKGRFKRKAAAPDDDDADPDAVGQQAAGDDQDADTDTGDTDDDPSKKQSADDDPDADDAGTDTIQTLDGLASALDISVEDLKESITHTFKAADEEMTVTLAELEKGYQKDADYRRQTGKLADDRRTAEQDYNVRMQQFDAQNHELAAYFNAVEQTFNARLNDPALAELRQRDPAEWNAQRTEIGQQVGWLQQQRQIATQQYSQFQQSQLGELKTREMSALKQAMPEFDTSHAQIARETMVSMGYAPEETAKIFDHRVVLGALELAAARTELATLRAEKAKAKDSVKRIKKDIPLTLKPGKQRTPGKGLDRTNVTRLRDRARKTGKVEDAAKVIESMIQ